MALVTTSLPSLFVVVVEDHLRGIVEWWLVRESDRGQLVVSLFLLGLILRPLSFLLFLQQVLQLRLLLLLKLVLGMLSSLLLLQLVLRLRLPLLMGLRMRMLSPLLLL